MKSSENQFSQGYSNGPPWLFRGSAIYQLHLVKADIARNSIPKELRLVEAFGYTLGGFFLAQYDDSPAGIFDELVVISGIVWNLPTSCAWASRVLVNSEEACSHGRKAVGLPSHVARFSKRVEAIPMKSRSKVADFLNMIGMSTVSCSPKDHMEIQVSDIEDPVAKVLCTIDLENPLKEKKPDGKWAAPLIKMSLPSFSGHTKHIPTLLKYSCGIECRLQLMKPARISAPTEAPDKEENLTIDDQHLKDKPKIGDDENEARNRTISVMLSKPLLALKFNNLKMVVHAPTIVSPSS